jgi:hypothetical protein
MVKCSCVCPSCTLGQDPQNLHIMQRMHSGQCRVNAAIIIHGTYSCNDALHCILKRMTCCLRFQRDFNRDFDTGSAECDNSKAQSSADGCCISWQNHAWEPTCEKTTAHSMLPCMWCCDHWPSTTRSIVLAKLTLHAHAC